MHVYYNNTKIGECIDDDSAWNVINAYIEQINIKPKYYRMWREEDGDIVMDYGSHTNFFYLKD